MKCLFDYDVLVEEVFYKCWHILEYLEKHSSLSELDKEAIKATIMDALVYKKLINPEKESLDLEHLCIRNDLNHYTYKKNPNVCGIPLWMKEELRKKCLHITGGVPVSLFLAKPPSKISRYCVYDPNTAISSIFKDATFYDVFYQSPTRNVRIEEARPFVEVEIERELYLVDSLTKRIFKSSYFKENYGFEVVNQVRVSELKRKKKGLYQEHISERNSFGTTIPFYEMTISSIRDVPNQAEMIYEFHKCKEYYPQACEEAEEFKKAVNGGVADVIAYAKKKKGNHIKSRKR